MAKKVTKKKVTQKKSTVRTGTNVPRTTYHSAPGIFAKIGSGIRDVFSDVRTQYSGFSRGYKCLTWAVAAGVGLAAAAMTQRATDGETIYDGKLSEGSQRVTYVEEIGVLNKGAAMEFSRVLYNFRIEDDNSTSVKTEGRERVEADSISRVIVGKGSKTETYTKGPVFDAAQRTYAEARLSIKDKTFPDKGYDTGRADVFATGAVDALVNAYESVSGTIRPSPASRPATSRPATTSAPASGSSI